MKNQEKILTKPEKLAQLIYVASVRYIKAKKSPISEKKLNFSFTSSKSKSIINIDALENMQ